MLTFPKPKDQEGRVTLSRRQMQKLRRKWWNEGKRTCGICGNPIAIYDNYVLDHIIPASCHLKDDRIENLQPAHAMPCNFMKGSKRNYAP